MQLRRGNHLIMPDCFSGIRHGRRNMILRQALIIVDEFGWVCALGEAIQNKVDSKARSLKHGLSQHDIGIALDVLLPIDHGSIVAAIGPLSNTVS
jgi:hypothetical protein